MKTMLIESVDLEEAMSPQKDMENKLDRLVDDDNMKASIEWTKYVDKLGFEFASGQGKWTKEHVKVMDNILKKFRIK